MLLIRAWRDSADLGAQIRSALLARPSANVVILESAGVLVLAPSLPSLNRRMAAVERLLLVATGAAPPKEAAHSRSKSEATGVQPSKLCFETLHCSVCCATCMKC